MEATMPRPWPEVLRAEREACGLSLHAAATKLGTHPDHLKKVEDGHRKVDPRLLINALHLYGGSIFKMQRALHYEKTNK